MKKSLLLLASLALMLTASIVPTATTISAQEENTDELNFAISVDPDGLDPQRTTAASTFQVTNNIYDTLVKVTPEGEYIPGLAESWEVSEDGLTVTFQLVSDIAFHNGTPFNADAVLASFERLQGEGSPRANDYANITNIEVVSDTEITFTTETLDVELISKFAYPWAAIVEASVGDDLSSNPVGTGSYKMVNWVPQEILVLEANEDGLKDPAITTINLQTIPDAQARILALQSGEVDIMSISGDQVPLVESLEGYKINENPMNSLQLLAMNLQNENLAVPEVRQAINLVVDKDGLINNVWYGYGTKIGSHYPPVLKEFVDHSDQYAYNVEEAQALMEEAGYADGFTLDMYLPSDYQAYVDAGQIIAQELQQINITANIEIVEWAFWLESVYTGRNYDMTVMGHTGRLDAYQWLARYHTDSPENYFNYSNARVDEILETAPQTQDEAERTAMYQELQAILAEEVPALYIQSPTAMMIMDESLQGFTQYPIDIYEYADLVYE
ncbi:ABC transporter substrate-binding protein [Fundicoccus culcitae]|uniref:ABC transporter substrate-binding protein n=1 Tax=Fundicoccus culcitae TaxID=2969821 RepID=A0ABY5P4V2_9LACT|nr:ABC transporter substrate-binding protein [Fundicoccus culcitae]UUX33601.1 ABC transporter substrate-binding protein [Fundicoccus culcitae]